MRSENTKKMFFLCFIIVISFSQCALTQEINTLHNEKNIFLISTLNAYKKSVQSDTMKRMVALSEYITPLFTQFKYAKTSNFTHKILYRRPIAFARLKVVLALQKVQKQLGTLGISLTFFDAYRPWSVTKKMWEIMPDERYAANPAKGSNHNRGAAVDVSLVKIATGEPLPMPTAFDDFTEKAHHDFLGLSKEIIENRRILKEAMEQNGFVALQTEWWHYSLPNASQQFEVLNLNFKKLSKLVK